jgi:hypothetical protein
MTQLAHQLARKITFVSQSISINQGKYIKNYIPSYQYWAKFVQLPVSYSGDNQIEEKINAKFVIRVDKNTTNAVDVRNYIYMKDDFPLGTASKDRYFKINGFARHGFEYVEIDCTETEQ